MHGDNMSNKKVSTKRKRIKYSLADLLPVFDDQGEAKAKGDPVEGNVTPPPVRTEKKMRIESLGEYVTSPNKTKYFLSGRLGKGNFGEVKEYKSEAGEPRIVKWQLPPQTVKAKRTHKGFDHNTAVLSAQKAVRAGFFAALICQGQTPGQRKCQKPHGIMMHKIPGKHLDTFYAEELKSITQEQAFKVLLKMSVATITEVSRFHAEAKSVHCDIKPDNFHIVVEEGVFRVNILDTDSSVLDGEAVDDSEVNGKFADPELIQGRFGEARPAKYRHDIYSVGRVMEELLKMHKSTHKKAGMEEHYAVFEDIILGMKRARKEVPVAYTFADAAEQLELMMAAQLLPRLR